MNPRLVVSDVEGCVIPVNRSTWDLPALDRLAAYNRRAAAGEVPPLTLCSGRPAQFVEAVGQAIGLFVPAVCENGAVLFDPSSGRHRHLFDPQDRPRLKRVREYLRRELVDTGRARVAEGKEICISIIPLPGEWRDIRALRDELEERIRRELQMNPSDFTITYSAGAVDITPAGVDKASGVSALLAELGLEANQVLAVGDGGKDLPMLQLCGHSAAPANARPEVATSVDYVATRRETEGVLEILGRFTPYGFLEASPGCPRTP